MFRVAALLACAVSLAACDMLNTLADGLKYAKAVESDLERSTGMKPEVGFNWHNGRLETVTVTFPRIYEAKPLREVAEAVRSSVNSQFKQTPDDIVLAFSLGKPGPGATAEVDERNWPSKLLQGSYPSETRSRLPADAQVSPLLAARKVHARRPSALEPSLTPLMGSAIDKIRA